MNKKILKELALAFVANVLGMTVWYYLGIFVFSDLYSIELTYFNVLTHYALPIGFLATFFFYVELWIYSLSMKSYCKRDTK